MLSQETQKDVKSIFEIFLRISDDHGNGCIELNDLVKDLGCFVQEAICALVVLQRYGLAAIQWPKSLVAHNVIHFQILNKSMWRDPLWAV